MIFYFTGTGNSAYIAEEIAKKTNDKVVSISKLVNENNYDINLEKDENIGFIFPIYAWAPPAMVIEFIKKVKFNNLSSNYIFSVATCGANIGNAMKYVDKALESKNLNLHSGFSVIMPNNYIIMGDVDSKKDENLKLEKSKDEVIKIVSVIKNKEKGVFKVTKGFMGAILTSIVSPLFNKHGMDTSKFYADDKCIGCGVCERVCNCKSITLVNKKPTWKKECTQCLACIHACPTKALQYGKGTIKKGRYINPYYKY